MELSNVSNRDSCIYKIIDKRNNNFYIGSAVNLKKRMILHLYQFRKNKHCNIKLQRVYNKYGINNFDLQIVEFCSRDIIFEKEQHYIDTLNPYFNISKTAKGGCGKHSDESKKLMSDIKKEYYKIDRFEEIEKIRECNRVLRTGIKLSKEHKEKI